MGGAYALVHRLSVDHARGPPPCTAACEIWLSPRAARASLSLLEISTKPSAWRWAKAADKRSKPCAVQSRPSRRSTLPRKATSTLSVLLAAWRSRIVVMRAEGKGLLSASSRKGSRKSRMTARRQLHLPAKLVDAAQARDRRRRLAPALPVHVICRHWLHIQQSIRRAFP